MAEAAASARGRSETARERGVQLLEKGDLRGALAAYDEALSAARETSDAEFTDFIYACRAAAAAELDSCDQELLELKRILLRAGDSQTAFRAAYTGARIYEIRRDYKKALFYSRIARDHAQRLADPILKAGCESQAGNLLTIDCRFEEAAATYRQAIEESRNSLHVPPLWQAIDRENLGYCLIVLGEVSEGLRLVHDALEFFEKALAREFTVQPLMDLCFGYLKSDRFEEARYFGEEGLDRLELSNDPAIEKNLLYLVGEACHLGGDAPSAQEYFDRLAAHYPEFRNLRTYLDVFDFRNVINLRA